MSISSPSNSDDSPLFKAYSAEREASRRIESAGQSVKDAQTAAQLSLERVQDTFEKQNAAESARNQLALQNQQLKGYEQVRDLQRSQQTDLRRLRTSGEKELSQLSDYYTKSKINLEQSSRQQLDQAQRQSQIALDETQKKNTTDLENFKTQSRFELQNEIEKSEELLKQQKEAQLKEYDKLKNNLELNSSLSKNRFDEKLNNTIQQHKQLLDDIETRASEQVREIRENTSKQLSNYANRLEDPFYKLINLQAELNETSNAFILTAQIPEHEQEHISTSIKGDNLIISGYRRNEETQEIEPGHSQGTSTFQTFHESFPLSWPVDENRLTKEFAGNQVIIRVPKKNQYAFKTPPPKTPEKLKVEHPHLPAALTAPVQSHNIPTLELKTLE